MYKETFFSTIGPPRVSSGWIIKNLPVKEKNIGIVVVRNCYCTLAIFSHLWNGLELILILVCFSGFADLITLDAAELYIAGKYYGLVPIAAENYGRDSSYYAVAIVKKIDKHLIISNMKSRKVCHSGISKVKQLLLGFG